MIRRTTPLFFDYLWLIPFFVFFGTYIGLHIWYRSTTFATPSIIGKNLIEATKVLTQHQLQPLILQVKEDAELPDGTIISQIPRPGRAIKEHQTVYVAISEQPHKPIMPSYLHKSRDLITATCKKNGLNPKFYQITYPFIQDHCFAQWPAPGEPLSSKSIIIYVACEDEKLIIVPDFTGKTVQEVQELVQDYAEIEIEQTNNLTKTELVSDQRPQAGSIIALDKLQKVHLTC